MAAADRHPRIALKTILTALVLFLFILSSGVMLALHFRPLYYRDIQTLRIEEKSGLSREQIKANYDALIDYNLLWNRQPLELPDFSMSEEGRIHFQEVKVIFDLFQILFFVSLSLMILIRWKAKCLRGRAYVRICGFICIGVVGALGLFALIGWDKLFVAFHHVFFRNDYWIFDAATDPVITILPDTFFLHEALLILGCVLAGGIVCLIWGFGRKKARNSRAAS